MADLSSSSIPSGSAVDQTNATLSGTYFPSVVSATQVAFPKSGLAAFAATNTPGVTVTDNANTALNGTHKQVTAVNAVNLSVSYNTTGPDTAQKASSGSVVNTSNEIFNNSGNPITITAVTPDSISYPLTGSDLDQTQATGTITDQTNTGYFNGTYTVKDTPSSNTFTYVRVPGGQAYNLTNLMTNPSFEVAGSTSAIRTNLCTNPSFETDLSGWAADGTNITIARSTADHYNSHDATVADTASMLVTKNTLTSTSAGVYFTVSTPRANMTYTVSAYVKNNAGNAKPYLSAVTVPGSGNAVVFSGSNPVTLTSTWTRISYSFKTTNTDPLHIRLESGAATTAASSFYVDAVLIERTPNLYSYFDSNTPAAGDFTYALSSSMPVQNAILPSGVTPATDTTSLDYARGYMTTAWTNSTTHSLAMVNRGEHDDQFLDISSLVTLTAGQTYTFRATVRTTEAVTNSQQIRLQVQNSSGTTSTIYSGITGAPGTYVRLYNRLNEPGQLMYWDDIMIVLGNHTDAPFFSGASTSDSLVSYAWTTGTGTTLSTSSRTYVNASVDADILADYGDAHRLDSPASIDILYRSGWLG